MAEPRKVFRIEQTAAMRRDASRPRGRRAARRRDHARARGAARRAVGGGARLCRQRQRHARSRAHLRLNLIADAIDDSDRHAARRHRRRIAARACMPVTAGTAQATQKILAAAEEIDSAGQQSVGRAQGQDRAEPRPRHPGSRHRNFRGLQFSGSDRPARRQGMATLRFVEDHIAACSMRSRTRRADAARRRADPARPAARQRRRPCLAERDRRPVRQRA